MPGKCVIFGSVTTFGARKRDSTASNTFYGKSDNEKMENWVDFCNIKTRSF